MANDFLNQLFSYYDKLVSPLSVSSQALISIALLIFLIWNIYAFLKSGHWIFIVLLLAALPGTWPAAKNIAHIIWLIIQGLLYRSQH